MNAVTALAIALKKILDALSGITETSYVPPDKIKFVTNSGAVFELTINGMHKHNHMDVIEKITSDGDKLIYNGKDVLNSDDLYSLLTSDGSIEIKNELGKIKLISKGETGIEEKMERTDLTTLTVGGLAAGSNVYGKTSIEILEEMLYPYQKPVINTFTLNPNTTTYEIGTVITSLVLNTSITKKSKPLTFVKFYDGSTLLDNKTTGVANGGNFSYTYSLNNNDTDMTLKVECSDGDNTVNKTTTVKFARNTFYGTDSATNAPYTTSANIRALSGKKLGMESGNSFTITIPVGTKKVVFAIPSTLNMTDVTYQEGLGASVKGVFTQSTINVEGANGYTGIDYKVYEYAPVSAFSSVCHYTVVL